MEYVDKLLQETDFLQKLKELEQLEENRGFCRHGLPHLLDTARIAWIQVLERREHVRGQRDTENLVRQLFLDLGKEQIYLAALLHDLGRLLEYQEGMPHHQAGEVLAGQLLAEIGYPKEQAEVIAGAISEHRVKGREEEGLSGLLAWADQESRNCFFCNAREACDWELEKQKKTIRN